MWKRIFASSEGEDGIILNSQLVLDPMNILISNRNGEDIFTEGKVMWKWRKSFGWHIHKAKNIKNCQQLPELKSDIWGRSSWEPQITQARWHLDFKFLLFRTLRVCICCFNPPCWWFNTAANRLANTHNWSVFKYLHAKFSLNCFYPINVCVTMPLITQNWGSEKIHQARIALTDDCDNLPVFLSFFPQGALLLSNSRAVSRI